MLECQESYGLALLDQAVVYSVGKTPQQEAANIPCHCAPHEGLLCNCLNGLINFINEPMPKARFLRFIPTRRSVQIGAEAGVEAESHRKDRRA